MHCGIPAAGQVPLNFALHHCATNSTAKSGSGLAITSRKRKAPQRVPVFEPAQIAFYMKRICHAATSEQFSYVAVMAAHI